jgi:hypothetical protein
MVNVTSKDYNLDAVVNKYDLVVVRTVINFSNCVKPVIRDSKCKESVLKN